MTIGDAVADRPVVPKGPSLDTWARPRSARHEPWSVRPAGGRGHSPPFPLPRSEDQRREWIGLALGCTAGRVPGRDLEGSFNS